MFEYIFSHQLLADKFCAALDERQVSHVRRDDELGFVVAIDEDLDDALDEDIEALYDELMVLSEQMLDAEADVPGQHVTALRISLKNGETTQALIRPALMNKLMAALSFAEINELVEAITDSIEHPDNRPLCQRSADPDAAV